MWLSDYSYVPIDCGTVSREKLLGLRQEVDLESRKTVVYLDELAALHERDLESTLLKAIDESQATWIGSTIATRKKVRNRRTGKRPELSIPMLGRFGCKVGSSSPSASELSEWILSRCKEWGIEILDPSRTLPIVMERTNHRVGYVLHFLADAASRGYKLTPEQAEEFNVGPAD
jgi:hypothetical protein